MLNHEDIRNASFSLLPTGYNPEEVDAVLNATADKVAAGEDIADLVTNTSFEVSDVGYSPAEVDEFLATLVTGSDEDGTATEDMPADPTGDVAPDIVEAPVELEVDTAEPDEVEAAEPDLAEFDEIEAVEPDFEPEEDDAGVDELIQAEAPEAVAWQPSSAVLDLGVLGQAVHRTAETLGSLQGFMENEMGAMKLAVERQAQDTAKRCENLLAEASAQAVALTDSVNEEISRARKAAERQIERERRELAKELKQAREESEADAERARSEAESYAAGVRAEADKDRAEAQRTIENAISMQSSIAESLERARQQLAPSTPVSDDLAA